MEKPAFFKWSAVFLINLLDFSELYYVPVCLRVTLVIRNLIN